MLISAMSSPISSSASAPDFKCVTGHTARLTGITNMYLSHKYNIVQMMHVRGHKTQKTFIDYIKLSSEETADELVKSANTLKIYTI